MYQLNENWMLQNEGMIKVKKNKCRITKYAKSAENFTIKQSYAEQGNNNNSGKKWKFLNNEIHLLVDKCFKDF